MKAKEITVGLKVFMRVSGSVVPVRVDSIYETTNYKGRSSTVYHCTNLKTGRPCKARSAAKFRGIVPQQMPTATQVKAMFDAKDRANEKQAAKSTNVPQEVKDILTGLIGYPPVE